MTEDPDLVCEDCGAIFGPYTTTCQSCVCGGRFVAAPDTRAMPETKTTYRVLFEEHDPRDYVDALRCSRALLQFGRRTGTGGPKPLTVIETTWEAKRERTFDVADFLNNEDERKRVAAIEKKKADIARLKRELRDLELAEPDPE